jgi:hypothetical protein
LVSLVAPVCTDTVTDPDAVGVPETLHEIDAPAATVAGGVGVHVPTVTPAGSPLIAHVAALADALAPALFVHSTVPLYGTPTVAVPGRPDRSGLMSEPVVVIDDVAVLFAVFGSFVAPVVPVSDDEPGVVGVPDTVHVIDAPGLTVAGGVGVQLVVSPGGSPLIEHNAVVAAIAGAPAFVHVNVPV